MGRNGKPTKDKILSESKKLILQNGFSGTSIDLILDKTGITKGAFFYHFKTKNALAKTLIEEFAKEDLSHMNEALDKIKLHKGDSLDKLLQFVQEFIDLMSNLSEPVGCLYASYIYEPNQFSQEINNSISEMILKWRETLENLVDNVLKEYTMKIETDKAALADQFTVIFEGAFMVSRALNDPEVTAKQLILFKNYIQLLFEAKG